MILKSESNQTKHINEITENDLKSDNWYWRNSQNDLFLLNKVDDDFIIAKRVDVFGDKKERYLNDDDVLVQLARCRKFKPVIQKFKELKYKKFDIYV